ncbi:MAG: transglycosylase domain-containing protein [Candidatus Saccharimonadales bacterium]
MAKKPTKSRQMNVYSNLSRKRKTKKDTESRKKAEYLASLPKHPVKRALYRMHPKRFFAFWFSKKGFILALKVSGVAILVVALMVGAVFAYYRKDLDTIRPGELAKRVQTTVTTYQDRNGKTLWEDKGDGNYKLVVDSKDINPYMKQATIAIEDKDFYKHGGVSISGITRSLINNTRGGSTQGGSTLTQQLVKQVFFSPDEAQKRGLDGIPRKIKEMILSIEVERMYNKEQILALYLNESPYGGRRNGVQSGAQTYFGKQAADLNLAESALLAAIPNNPNIYNPYNIAGHEALVERQHKVLDGMVAENFITQKQADEAKKYPILDTIKSETEQLKGIKAPHFVQMVRAQLEAELGKATVGRGGLIVKTSLDLDIQNKLEADMKKLFNGGFGYDTTPGFIGYSNGSAAVEDVKTGQIVAMVGSRNFNYPGFGQDNAAMAFIQPGSSIKPLVYAQLFQDQGKDKVNYGSGSILADDHSIDDIYGAPLKNADGAFMGSINIRRSLTMSRNIPAIKAMYIAGKDETWKTIRALGDTYYCTQGSDAQAGLSSAIGGCGTRLMDHTNAMASLARMGVYKPWTGVLEVKNSTGETLKKYKDQSKQVIDPQSAYIVNDILGDVQARKNSRLYGGGDGSGTTE